MISEMWPLYYPKKTSLLYSCRPAFTLVELLIVIAVIGVLIGLLLPAVQSAREAGRRSSCKSKLRQVGLGLLSFHDIHGEFPQGGWGRAWIPVPERGIGKQQPGGWVYQTLPFLEERAAFQAVRATAGAGGDTAVGRVEVPIALFNCPSRRASRSLPVGNASSHQQFPRPSGGLTVVARGDYAINSGASHIFRLTGPPNIAEGDSPSFWSNATDNEDFTGISHLHRSVGLRRVLDGASNTYLAGEKFLSPRNYENGQSIGDDETLFSGFANDNHRWVAWRPEGASGDNEGSIVYREPLRDTDAPVDPPGHERFGSSHPAGCNMLFCDGSVRVVNYDIDRRPHYFFGHRHDHGSLSR